ncbi:MAG: WD40/YVTN/BNR-like repeat-containing protein, partial [Thermoanaerobaculia bacterium]
VDPRNPDTVYVTSGNTAYFSYVSRNGGASWQFLPYVGVIAMDPGPPETLYGYGIFGAGNILKSTDGGSTWKTTSAGPPRNVRLAVDRRDGGRLYAIDGDGALWTSVDRGASWTQGGDPGGPITSFTLDPANPAALYVGTSLGIFHSTDRGETFLAVHGGLRLTEIFSFAAGQARSGPLYVSEPACRLSRSDDGGRTWCCVDPAFSGGLVAVDPANPMTVYANFDRLSRSLNGGLTWTPVPFGDATPASYVVFDPRDPSTLYGLGSGLLKSSDGGESWTSIMEGLPRPYLLSFAVDPQSTSTLYATTYDYECGTRPGSCHRYAFAFSKSIEAGRLWFPVALPEGIVDPWVQLPPNEPGVIYILSAYGGAFRSRDHGLSWSKIHGSLTSFTFDPADPSNLYGIDFYPGAVWRSADRGSTWQPFGDAFVKELWIDPSGTVLRAATLGRGLQEYEIDRPVRLLSPGSGETFSVSLTARDPRTGRSALGRGVQHTDDFAWFSLPELTGNLETPEVLVKILDGRAVNHSFWIFYGGLTDVEYTLSVTEKSGARVKTYVKAAGSACGGFDTEAFPSPGQPAPRKSFAASCEAESELRLNPGRPFVVRVIATDPRTGRTGQGAAAIENDSFGTFSLPALTGNLSNPEVFVKILDGRALNGSFWIFYGGLTDLEYEISVTDQVTGRVQTYTKSAGSSCGGYDTSSFTN